jgi:hypothetical protein
MRATLSKPLVRYNLFVFANTNVFRSVYTDLDIHVEMAKYARTVGNTAPLNDMVAKETNPGPDVRTDEQWAGPTNSLQQLITY